MDPAVFWSGFGGAIAGAFVGGLFTLIGGSVQTSRTLKEQRKQQFLAAYQPILSAVLDTRGALASLAAYAEDTVSGKADPQHLNANLAMISETAAKLGTARASAEWLLLIGEPSGLRTAKPTVGSFERFMIYTNIWYDVIRSNKDIQELRAQREMVDMRLTSAIEAVQAHTVALNRYGLQRFHRLMPKWLRKRLARRALAKLGIKPPIDRQPSTEQLDDE